MVLLMLALELLISSIGAAIAAAASFAVFILPYALAVLPLYILYRVIRARWPKLTRRLRRKSKAKPSIRQAAASHRPRPATPLQVRAEAPPSTRVANDTPPLAHTYGEGLAILKRQMRGPLLRGEIPWFLAFGVGGPALLATDPTHVRWPEDGKGEFGAWWFCEGAAILHAGTDSSDGAKLSDSWPSLVSAMRARPMRRPLDGILLMVGADELRAAAEREAPRAALAKRAAALRERLRTLRDDLGVICPVHVVVVRAEALDGFAELCATVPSAMLDSVLGWTNQQDWTLPFDPRRVDEAFESLRADLALLEADALAAGTAGMRLPLLPASLDTLRHPLALFLDGALGGEDGAEPFPLRGIALTGAHTTITGGRRPAFARDLLPGRAFAESGFGRPSEAAFLRARTRRRQAQGALAASVVGLSLAAWQGVSSVSAGVPAVAGATGDLRRALLSRDAAPDAETVGRVIAATVRMERDRLATPLLPTSLFSGFDEDKRRLASVTVRRAVLRPIRDALLPSPLLADLPPSGDVHQVEDLPSFRRLAAQFERIGGRRDALERYDRFRRSSGFDELLALSESVFGAVPKPATAATDGFITRIAAGANLPNLDARTIAAAVRAESVRLATPLAEDLYARNPLRVQAQALADRLRDLPQPPSADDVAEIRRLVDAVTDAAGWPIAAALRAPSLGLPDPVKLALQKAAIAELPGRDAADRITEALATAATDSRAALGALEAPPVGRLFTLPDDGGTPVPVPALAELPTVLAALVPPEPPAPIAEAPAKAEPPKETAKPPKAEPVKVEPVKAEAPAPEPAKPPAAPAKPMAEAPVPAPVVAPPPPARTVTAPSVAMLPAPTVPAIPDGEAAVAKLAASFSQTLAGRFPFVRADLARGAPDADPQDVRRFYQTLDENRSALARHASPELTGFLERMEAARPLLEAVAKAAPISVSLAYGVNRGQEIGAEHIIDWSVRSGNSAVGVATDAEPLVWKAGQPVLLSFRWAAGSPYRPKSAAANAAEAAAGDTLTVVERGPWALLRLLKGRTAASVAGRDGTVLRIALPTQTIGGDPARDTVLFMAASVRVGARSSTPLTLPDLPARFPSW